MIPLKSMMRTRPPDPLGLRHPIGANLATMTAGPLSRGLRLLGARQHLAQLLAAEVAKGSLLCRANVLRSLRRVSTTSALYGPVRESIKASIPWSVR
jgi:hypothetical protein